VANTKKKAKPKPAVKDMPPKSNPKGGRDAASGLPTGQRIHKPFTLK